MAQRRRDAQRRREAGDVVGQRDRGQLHRLPLGVALHVGEGQARVRAGHHVGGGARRHGAAIAEPAQLAVDEVGPDGAQRLIVDPQPLGDAHPVVRRHHIDSRDELMHQFPPARVREVDRDAALPPVQRLEALTLVGQDGAALPVRIPAQRLHLDHVRAQVAQQDAGVGQRDDLRELQDPHPCQGTRALWSITAGHVERPCPLSQGTPYRPLPHRLAGAVRLRR